jgi:hypothetical protein
MTDLDTHLRQLQMSAWTEGYCAGLRWCQLAIIQQQPDTPSSQNPYIAPIPAIERKPDSE